MKNVSLGIDIGGSHIKSAAIVNGEIVKGSIASENIDNKASAEDVFLSWAQVINRTLNTLPKEKIDGLGFAMPGAFNYKTGIAGFEGNDKYENLFGLNVEEYLRPLLAISYPVPFRYHNDASCFAIGENQFGVARGFKKILSITLGTGFGAAFVENGVPIVDRNDVPKDGCLWYIPYKEGIADDYFSTRWFVKQYMDCTGKTIPGVKELAALAQYTAQVQAIFNQFGADLANFLSPYLKEFEAELVVIGGNISGAFSLFEHAYYEVLEANQIDCKTSISTLKEDAAILGSSRLVDNTFYNELIDQLPTK